MHVTSPSTWPIDSPLSHVTIWFDIIMSFPNGGTLERSIYLQPFFEILASKRIEVTTLTFLGHVTSSVTWPFDSQLAISYSCSIVTNSVSPAIFEIMGTKRFAVTTLTFQGHVTSSVTWPFDSGWVISYRCSIDTKSLSPAIFEIMGTKHIGVTTLTFQDHVKSSVTWPFDSRGAISYWWSFGLTSLTIYNGFRGIVPQTSCAHRHNAKSSLPTLRMRDITWCVSRM